VTKGSIRRGADDGAGRQGWGQRGFDRERQRLDPERRCLHMRNARLVLDEPTELPEGTELALTVLDEVLAVLEREGD
jgi:hypothetical protein